MTGLLDFTDKSVIITGGARGIGRGIVQLFAEAGADVVIGDRRLEDANETAANVSEVYGRRVVAVEIDVTNYADVERMRDEALATLRQDRRVGKLRRLGSFVALH